MHVLDERLPSLSNTLDPPRILGTADLTSFAYQGNTYDSLIDRIRCCLGADAPEAAYLLDTATALQLAFKRREGLALQEAVLEQCQMFRLGAVRTTARTVRVLALMGPGDLMANTPLDFLTNDRDIRLDLLYVLPGQALPAVIPDHDVAFFAVGEADQPMLDRLRRLYSIWPRPTLNNPGFLPAMERDALSGALAGVPGLCSPVATAISRDFLDRHLLGGGAQLVYPCLIRPAGSHAGADLARLEGPADLMSYLGGSFEQDFFVTAFQDYRGLDGLYRKSRVAFINRKPFLCHMAISSHWMVHYLNAGMTESVEKRAEEARAMADFDAGFARRHAKAFDAIHERLGFDYYSIDCGETTDGRLLVFEADSAAIVHLMDPPDLFPYKQPQMQRVFAAFEDLLRHPVRTFA